MTNVRTFCVVCVCVCVSQQWWLMTFAVYWCYSAAYGLNTDYTNKESVCEGRWNIVLFPPSDNSCMSVSQTPPTTTPSLSPGLWSHYLTFSIQTSCCQINAEQDHWRAQRDSVTSSLCCDIITLALTLTILLPLSLLLSCSNCFLLKLLKFHSHSSSCSNTMTFHIE